MHLQNVADTNSQRENLISENTSVSSQHNRYYKLTKKLLRAAFVATNFLAVLALIAFICYLTMGSVFGRISEETPKFALVRALKKHDVQIRRYAPNTAIMYDRSARPSDADRNGDENGGFMKLAGYIGVGGRPQNDKGEAIAMTAPVLMTNSRKMNFILPSSETRDGHEPPRPTNPDVHVVKRGEVLMAVKTFSGSWGDEAFDTQKK